MILLDRGLKDCWALFGVPWMATFMANWIHPSLSHDDHGQGILKFIRVYPFDIGNVVTVEELMSFLFPQELLNDVTATLRKRGEKCVSLIGIYCRWSVTIRKPQAWYRAKIVHKVWFGNSAWKFLEKMTCKLRSGKGRVDFDQHSDPTDLFKVAPCVVLLRLELLYQTEHFTSANK